MIVIKCSWTLQGLSHFWQSDSSKQLKCGFPFFFSNRPCNSLYCLCRLKAGCISSIICSERCLNYGKYQCCQQLLLNYFNATLTWTTMINTWFTNAETDKFVVVVFVLSVASLFTPPTTYCTLDWSLERTLHTVKMNSNDGIQQLNDETFSFILFFINNHHLD